MNDRPKPLPDLPTDKDAEDFVANADLSDYDLSGFRPVRFEFERKEARINMRVPASLLDAIKTRATECGIPYQRLIREVLERELQPRRSATPR